MCQSKTRTIKCSNHKSNGYYNIKQIARIAAISIIYGVWNSVGLPLTFLGCTETHSFSFALIEYDGNYAGYAPTLLLSLSTNSHFTLIITRLSPLSTNSPLTRQSGNSPFIHPRIDHHCCYGRFNYLHSRPISILLSIILTKNCCNFW
jgi:hypothetical protein